MMNDDGRRRNEDPYWIVYKKLDTDISGGDLRMESCAIPGGEQTSTTFRLKDDGEDERWTRSDDCRTTTDHCRMTNEEPYRQAS